MSCFLKTTAKKLETNTLLVPNLKVGDQSPRFPRLLCLCVDVLSSCNRCVIFCAIRSITIISLPYVAAVISKERCFDKLVS